MTEEYRQERMSYLKQKIRCKYESPKILDKKRERMVRLAIKYAEEGRMILSNPMHTPRGVQIVKTDLDKIITLLEEDVL